MTEQEKELTIDPEIERLSKLIEDVDLDLPENIELSAIALQRYEVVRQFKLLNSQVTGLKKHRKLAAIGGEDKYLKQVDERINDLARSLNQLKMQVASIDEEYPQAKVVMQKNLAKYEARNG